MTRAIAIATGLPYRKVYDDLAACEKKAGRAKSARNGIAKKITRAYLSDLGWEWTPTMQVGSSERIHLRPGGASGRGAGDLPVLPTRRCRARWCGA